MRAEVGRRGRDFAISIHINSFAFGCRCEFAFSFFGFLLHYFFLGFCLLVAFVLLEPAAGTTLPHFLELKYSGIVKFPIAAEA